LSFMKKTLIHELVETAHAGTNKKVICRVPSGWVMLGSDQFLKGYSLLIPDPVVEDLNSLGETQRKSFLNDMTILGDALIEVTGAYRINYEILGNIEPVLHAHVFPRYLSEPENLRKSPVWFYYSSVENLRQFNLIGFDYERDKNLMEQIAGAVQKRL